MRLLILTRSELYNGIFHFSGFCKELQKYDIECKIEDQLQFLCKFFDFKKLKKRKLFDLFLDKTKPDLVLLDDHSDLVFSLIKKKIPFLFLVRGHLWQEEKLVKETITNSFIKKIVLKRKHYIMEKCLKEALIIIPISNFLANVVRNYFPEKSIEVLHMDGRDPDLWKPKHDMKLKHPCVGLLQGAGVWGKTEEMLVLEKVLKTMPDVTFYWAGDGIYREKILSQLKKYQNFKWLGKLGYPDKVLEFLSEIDVYALFSGMDGLGQSVIEASFIGKPIIATNVGGIPETMIENESGFLVEKGNSEQWIQRLTILLNDRNLSKEMGKSARDFVLSKFSWQQITKEFVNILKKHEIN